MFWFFSELRTLPVQTTGLGALAQVALLSIDRFSALSLRVCLGSAETREKLLDLTLSDMRSRSVITQMKICPQRLLSILFSVKPLISQSQIIWIERLLTRIPSVTWFMIQAASYNQKSVSIKGKITLDLKLLQINQKKCSSLNIRRRCRTFNYKSKTQNYKIHSVLV